MVSEVLLNGLDVIAGVDRGHGVGVSEIVKAKVFNAVSTQGFLQHLPDTALRQMPAEFVGEYQIRKSTVVPCCASVQTLFQLLDLVFLQYLHDVGRRPDRAGFVIFGRSECVLPVSYTHLDVYKRQDLELGKSIDSAQAHAKGSDSNAGRKIIAKRYRFSTRKRAYEEAKRAGGGREPKFHRDSRGPHFHPSVDNPYSRTPHGASRHDHYYFPERYYEGTFYYETIEIEFITIEEVEDSPINNIDRSYLLIA